MRTFEEFKTFVESDIMPMLQALEQERRFIYRMYLVPQFLGGLGTLVFFGAMYYFREYWLLLAMAALTSPFLPRFLSEDVDDKLAAFHSRYKELIIKPIVAFVAPELHYKPGNYIMLKHFVSSGLFLHYPDRYFGEDLVHGKLGKTNLAFSEVQAKYKTEYYDSKLQKQTVWHTIFKGFFLIADFPKSFRGRTIILPDKTEKILGPVISDKIQKTSLQLKQLIKMENIDFEKEFVVYGDNQLESRYILTPEIMERILDFKRKAQTPVYFSFAGNSMFIGVPTREDYFEPSYRKTIVNRDLMYKFYERLSLFIGIVEDFNLNTRIWN